jgi:hypothetical protein
MTPKEFAAEVLAGRRSPRWVCDRCREWRKSRGRKGIPTVTPGKPYLIPPSAAEAFR